jgi:hypothetical protein
VRFNLHDEVRVNLTIAGDIKVMDAIVYGRCTKDGHEQYDLLVPGYKAAVADADSDMVLHVLPKDITLVRRPSDDEINSHCVERIGMAPNEALLKKRKPLPTEGYFPPPPAVDRLAA